MFTATKAGFHVDVVNTTISAGQKNHFISMSLAPVLERTDGLMRLVMNWGNRKSSLDMHVVQIDK